MEGACVFPEGSLPGRDHSNDNQTERSCQNFLVTSALLNSDSVYTVGGSVLGSRTQSPNRMSSQHFYSCGNNKRGNQWETREIRSPNAAGSQASQSPALPFEPPTACFRSNTEKQPLLTSSSFCPPCVLHNLLLESACKLENSAWERLYFIQEQRL